MSLSTDVVESNKSDLDAFVKARRIEMSSLASANPVLNYRFTNPDFAKVAHPDYENLGIVEKSTRAIQAFGSGITEDLIGGGLEGMGQYTNAAVRKITGYDTSIGKGLIYGGKQIQELSKQYIAPSGGDLTKVEQVSRGVGQAAAQVGMAFLGPVGFATATTLLIGQGAKTARDKIDLSPLCCRLFSLDLASLVIVDIHLELKILHRLCCQ